MSGPEQAATVTPGQAAPDAARAACEAFWDKIGAGPHGQPEDAAWQWARKASTREAWEAAVKAAIKAAPHGSERVAELVTEGNELRALVGEILDAVEATTDRAGMQANIAIWRKRAGLTAAVVTAGTEHLAEKIRGLAIPDEL